MNGFPLSAILPIVGVLLYALALVFLVSRSALKTAIARGMALCLGLLILSSTLALLAAFELLPEALAGYFPSLFLILIGANLLWLTQAVLQTGRLHWPWILLGVVWLAGWLTLALNPFALPDTLLKGHTWFIARANVASLVLAAGWVIFMARMLFLSIKASRLTTQPLIKNRSHYWVLALLAYIAGDLLLLFYLYDAAYALRLPAILLLTIIILRPYMPDIRQMERRALHYLVMTLLTAIVLLVGLFIAVPLIERARGYNPTLVGAIAALFLAALLPPVRNLSNKIVEHLLPGRKYEPNRVLREYSQSVSSILDPELLATVSVGMISEAIEIQSGCLFLVEFETEDSISRYRLQGTRGMGDIPPDPGFLSLKGPVATYFLKERKPLPHTSLGLDERFQASDPEELAWLNGLAADVYIPIYTKEDWVGLIVLGPKLNGLPYFEDDLDLLGTLADQTAVALQNARLVESLMRLNNDFRRAYAAMEQANRHLKQMNVQLENLDRTKSDFISVASHELRTPLTVMRGYNEMLLEDPAINGNPFHSKLIKGIYSGIMRLHEIVNSMLDMASIDTRSLELKVESVSLNSLIKMVCDGVGDSFRERDLQLEIENLRDLPQVDGDPEALKKVFYHLVINAIKYTPDGGKITITGVTVSPGQMNLADGGVEIIVADSGIGIHQDYLDLIFTKFYQTGELALHSTGKVKFKGAGPGLGLAIARGIVDAHRGKIWAESSGHDEEKCPGSQFHVVLPLHYREQ